jgi:predicted alpha/beta-fold hydrolase
LIRPSDFTPPRWLRNRHLQTILPNLPFSGRIPLDLRNEVLELPDGDFLRLEWLDADGPVVLILHGLEGSSRSPYARSMMRALHAAGLRCVLMSFRGCGGVPNRLARSYHAGETADLAYILAQIGARWPGVPIAALGYSLGGNVLLKYLGECGEDAQLATAVAVSVPFDLTEASAAMSLGVARLYRALLLRRLKDSVRRKFSVRTAPFDLAHGLAASDFETFDDRVTAPLHGFADAPDYYRKSSSRAFLKRIRVPTLILHAADDPFMTRAVIPREDELSDAITFELSRYGGHVGFLTGATPWGLRCWLVERIVSHYVGAFRGLEARSNGESDAGKRYVEFRRRAGAQRYAGETTPAPE